MQNSAMGEIFRHHVINRRALLVSWMCDKIDIGEKLIMTVGMVCAK